MTISQKIAKYKFEDSKKRAWATPVGNALLFLVFLLGSSTTLQNPHAIFCLFTILFFGSIQWMYTWTKFHLNTAIIIFYIALCSVEFITFGFPEPVMQASKKTDKGILLDILVISIPWLYIALRFLLVIPLLILSKHAKHRHA